jgi:RHS repeat-associated protein
MDQTATCPVGTQDLPVWTWAIGSTVSTSDTVGVVFSYVTPSSSETTVGDPPEKKPLSEKFGLRSFVKKELDTEGAQFAEIVIDIKFNFPLTHTDNTKPNRMGVYFADAPNDPSKNEHVRVHIDPSTNYGVARATITVSAERTISWIHFVLNDDQTSCAVRGINESCTPGSKITISKTFSSANQLQAELPKSALNYTREAGAVVAGIGAYHFGARMYDPEIGVWLAADPADQFWNAYSYTGGHPVGLVDPDGMDAVAASEADDVAAYTLSETPEGVALAEWAASVDVDISFSTLLNMYELQNAIPAFDPSTFGMVYPNGAVPAIAAAKFLWNSDLRFNIGLGLGNLAYTVTLGTDLVAFNENLTFKAGAVGGGTNNRLHYSYASGAGKDVILGGDATLGPNIGIASTKGFVGYRRSLANAKGRVAAGMKGHLGIIRYGLSYRSPAF